MSDSVKVALILSVAIVLATTIAVSALIYFSPYQSCMRAEVSLRGLTEIVSESIYRGVLRDIVFDCAKATQ